jgi:magnesium transporter
MLPSNPTVGASCDDPSLRGVTEMLYGLGAAVRARVAALRGQGSFFWLDVSLSETSRDDLVDALAIPERALRALPGSGDATASRTFYADGESVVFALRCYVESETVADEAAYRLRPLEAHVLVTGEYLLTLHEERVSLPAALAPDLPEERSQGYVVYSVLDAMLATTSDALEEVELGLDAVGVAWAEGGGGRVVRAQLREVGPRIATMRRRVSAEQAVLARTGVEIAALRGFDTRDQSYFDRLYGQANRLLTSIDAAADATGMLLDLQLNQRSYLVSVLATIFLPLTFITGFFGMNFGWMTDHIHTPIAFWLLGFIVPLVTAVLCWRLGVRLMSGDFRQRRP